MSARSAASALFASASRRQAAWRRRLAGRTTPLVLGHRGVRGAAPENTMAAFETAADEGADGIELDVRVCKTGELVVVHDPDLGRATGGADRRAVADLSFAELRRADVGSGERVPPLSEVLAFARARGLLANVEMKHDVPSRTAVVRETARLLRACDPDQPVLVSSFDPAMLGLLALASPALPRALLVHRTSYHEHAARLVVPLSATAIHPERTITTAALVLRMKRRGVLVHVWTVNSEREARDLAAIGVDGLITDVPGTIRAALGASS